MKLRKSFWLMQSLYIKTPSGMTEAILSKRGSRDVSWSSATARGFASRSCEKALEAEHPRTFTQS
jgi:hypothetical protein